MTAPAPAKPGLPLLQPSKNNLYSKLEIIFETGTGIGFGIGIFFENCIIELCKRNIKKKRARKTKKSKKY